MALFLESKGRSKPEIGLLTMIPRLFSSCVAPLWSLLADKHACARQIVCCNNVATTLHTMLFQLIERDSSLALVALLVAMRAFYNTPCGSLIDGISTQILASAEYGEVRGIGALSFAVFSLSGGLLLQYAGGFAALFQCYFLLQAGTIGFLVHYLPAAVDVAASADAANVDRSPAGLVTNKANRATVSSSAATMSAILLIFADNRNSSLAFAACIAFSGMGFGVIESFLFIRLGSLGASGLLLGLARFVMTIVEVPVFWYAQAAVDWIVKAWAVPKRLAQWVLLLVTQMAFVLRFSYYAVLVDPWWVFPAELLHGFTFAMMWKLSVDYASDLATEHVPQSHGTMQTLLGGLHFGLSAGLGSALGGVVYDFQGPVFLFRCCVLLDTLSCILAAATCVSLYRAHMAGEGRREGGAALPSASAHGMLRGEGDAVEEGMEEEVEEVSFGRPAKKLSAIVRVTSSP